jgi:hypothetical protein
VTIGPLGLVLGIGLENGFSPNTSIEMGVLPVYRAHDGQVDMHYFTFESMGGK